MKEQATISPLGDGTKYEALAGVFFDVCLEFTNSVGRFASSSGDIDRYSTKVISMATTLGTAMYKYSARLACDRLSRAFPDRGEYRKNYDQLLYALANKLQEPEYSFVDSIEHLGKQETLEMLEGVSDMMGRTLDYYLGVIKNAIDDVLGKETQEIHSLSYSKEIMRVLNGLHNDFIRNPWENNPWVVLTRSVCGDKIARDVAQLDGMYGHGSILQICTMEESSAGNVLIKASLDSTLYSADEIEKAHNLLYSHDQAFWGKRLLLTKSGLSDTYYLANESEKENKARWSEYEKIYGKSISSKLRSINRFCPGWLADKIAKDEGLSWLDIQRREPAFWETAFDKYSPELSRITEECRGC